MNCRLFEMGTLYIGERSLAIPVRPNFFGDMHCFDGSGVPSIKDTVPGKEMRWIMPEGMDILICDRTVLSTISWDYLFLAKLVDGCRAVIGGVPFTCRLLSGVAKDGKASEWDQALSIVGNDDHVWHHSNMLFWVREKSKEHPEQSMTRGMGRHVQAYDAQSRCTTIGYRPVLKYIPPPSLSAWKTVMLDGQPFVVCLDSDDGPNAGSRLVLLPVESLDCDIVACEFDASVLGGMPLMHRIEAYTLLVDGKPVEQTGAVRVQYRPGMRVELTDVYYGQQYLIRWTIAGGCAFSDQALICDARTEALPTFPTWHFP